MAQINESTYGFAMDNAQAGQKAGLDFDHVESFAADGGIEFGLGVSLGASDDVVAASAADNETFVGVALFTHRVQQGIDESATGGEQYSTGAAYADGDAVNVLRKGRAYVEVTANVSAGEVAYVDVTTSGEEGKFTNVSTDNLATGGVFRTSADTGELAIVEVNQPN